MTQSTTPSRPKLLYVEDEVIVALDVADGLREAMNFDVHVAHNLRSAQRLVEKHAFEFALLDMNLGNGERSSELGEALAKDGVNVVFASGYNRNEIDAFSDFPLIEKPFQLSDIAAAFRLSKQPA